jgi:hypothetical protein
LAGTNNFQEFNPTLANAETDAQYLADTARLNGFVPGISSVSLFNKVFRQVSVMSAAIGQFIANQGFNASDADLTTLTSAVTNAIKAVSSVLATVREFELTTTNPTAIITYAPASSGNFMIGAYVRVVTGVTTITAAVTYTDTTGAQITTLINAQATNVGSWSLLPVYVDAIAGSTISVVVTAGTANRVYASASIVQV